MPNYADYRRRDENTGEWIFFCPDCKNDTGDGPLELGTRQRWQSHMQKEHGGYTEDNSDDSTPPAAPAAPVEPVQPKPKKLSSKSRELNDKLNECINLCIKHFMSGIDEQEKQRLETLRGEVSMGFMGVQFDFEEKLVTVSGRWAAIIVILALYILPQLPTFKQMREQATLNASEKPSGE